MSTATASPFVVEATNSGGSGEMPPEGNHAAVLVGLVDLGTHHDEYQGQPTVNRKILFAWEIPGEIKSDGAPHVLTLDFNMPEKLSGKSKLRSMLESWRGKPMDDGEKLDLGVLVGKACLINVGRGKTSKGKDFAKIMGVTPMVKGMSAPRPFATPFVWAVGSGAFAPPEWLPYHYGRPVLEHIEESDEWKGKPKADPEPRGEADESDIPF